jgi:hypothetical protein
MPFVATIVGRPGPDCLGDLDTPFDGTTPYRCRDRVSPVDFVDKRIDGSQSGVARRKQRRDDAAQSVVGDGGPMKARPWSCQNHRKPRKELVERPVTHHPRHQRLIERYPEIPQQP